MINEKENFKSLVTTVIDLLKISDLGTAQLVSDATVSIESKGEAGVFDEIEIFDIYVTVKVDSYKAVAQRLLETEDYILKEFRVASRPYQNQQINKVIIVPKSQNKIDWSAIAGVTTKDELIVDINKLKAIMISVSTGGDRIQDVNDTYKNIFIRVNKSLVRLRIDNPNPFLDLWNWYEKWKASLSSYQERRIFVGDLYNGLIQVLQETTSPDLVKVSVDLQGWDKVKRNITEIETRAVNLDSEEQCQGIGLLCREAIISLGQVVFDASKHPSPDGIAISITNSKRMLEAYIAIEFSGSSNENLRRYAKSTIDLANELTHKRTATKKDALLCKSATLALVNLIGIVEDKF